MGGGRNDFPSKYEKELVFRRYAHLMIINDLRATVSLLIKRREREGGGGREGKGKKVNKEREGEVGSIKRTDGSIVTYFNPFAWLYVIIEEI